MAPKIGMAYAQTAGIDRYGGAQRRPAPPAWCGEIFADLSPATCSGPAPATPIPMMGDPGDYRHPLAEAPPAACP